MEQNIITEIPSLKSLKQYILNPEAYSPSCVQASLVEIDLSNPARSTRVYIIEYDYRVLLASTCPSYSMQHIV